MAAAHPAVPAGQSRGPGAATLKKVKSKPKPAAKEKTKQKNGLPSRVHVGRMCVWKKF